MSGISMSPAAIRARLEEASAQTDLATEKRLETKIDLSPQAISDRLRAVSELRDLCLHLGRSRASSAHRMT